MAPFNYKDIMDAADIDGICHFRGRVWPINPADYEGVSGYERKRKVFNEVTSVLKGFVNTPKHVTRALVMRANPSIKIDTVADMATIEVNACPLLCLPGENPSLEIAEFRKFYETMRAAIGQLHAINEAHMRELGFVIATGESEMELLNEAAYSADLLAQAKKVLESINSQIKSSPILSQWRTNVVAMIRKMGPHSWLTLSDSIFFENIESPVFGKYKKLNEKQVNPEPKSIQADKALENYDFQDYEVVGQDGWDTSDPNDHIKVVYVTHPDDEPDADSTKLSFHVCFNEFGEASESYALDVSTGNYVGKNPETTNSKGFQP